MDSNQTISLLMQIGALAFTLGLLYILQRLMDEGDLMDNAQMERRIAYRRRDTQEHVAALKQMELDDVPLLSPDLAGIERALFKHIRPREERESESTPQRRWFDGEESEIWSLERWEEAPFETTRKDIKVSEEIYQ